MVSDIDESKIRQLDGALLLVLRELLRQRRTTRVAQRLGLSQSAVSHSLARLRELFDDPLFVRKPHGLEPTRHAVELTPRIDALIEAMGDAMGLGDRFEPETSLRDFRIAAPDHVATLLAPALLAAFREQAPRARFAFGQRLGREALESLSRDEIDLAIGRFGRPVDGIETDLLFEDRYCLIARRTHAKLRRGLTRAVYTELDHVQISVDGDFQSPEIEPVAERDMPRRAVAAVPRFLMAFPVVAACDAVAIAPGRLARTHAAGFGVRVHELPFALEPIRVLAARRARADRGVAWLIDLLKGLESGA